MKTLKEAGIGETVVVKKLNGKARSNDELWIWGLQKAYR